MMVAMRRVVVMVVVERMMSLESTNDLWSGRVVVVYANILIHPNTSKQAHLVCLVQSVAAIVTAILARAANHAHDKQRQAQRMHARDATVKQ
jgi:hypothetical protein